MSTLTRSWKTGTGRRLAIVVFLALVVAPLVTVAIASTFLFVPAGRILEIEMRATGGTSAQIYWSADYTMHGDRSAVAPLHQRPGEFERVRFPLPTMPLEVLRFDPLDGEGEVTIRQISVLDYSGSTVRTVDPLLLMPLHQIAMLAPDRDGIRIVTTPGANDPMMVTRSSWLAAEPRWYSLQFVTPFSLTWVALATAGLIAVCLAQLGREVVRSTISRRHLLWFAVVFVLILWAKLALLQHYAVPVPFWDQWDGEGATLYVPLPENGVSWRQMFTLHNEHRIFFSRLLAVVLLVVNGQWDPHLQIVVNAFLHGLGAVVLCAVLWLTAGRRGLPLVALVVSLAIAPPVALENSLAGFQSAFYFLVLFSVLTFWLIGFHRPNTARWWLGFFCALCCPFTVGGGTFIAAPVVCLAVLQAFSGHATWRQASITIAAMLCVVALGYAGLPPPIPYHLTLKAKSVEAFGVTLSRSLAFPWIENTVVGPFVWLPFVTLSVVVLARRLRTTAFEQVTLSLGVWVLLQATAIAYSRGSTGISPASRYLDMLSFGFIVNVMAVYTLAEHWLSARAKTLRYALVTGWVIVAAVGIWRLSDHMLTTAASVRRPWTREHLKNVRQFIESGDLTAFLKLRGPNEIPYHSPSMLAAWLNHPYIRRILPARVRQPLALRAADGSTTGFSLGLSAGDGSLQPLFDSYARDGAAGQGRFVSQPLECKDLGRLRFEVSGSSSWSGISLSLREIESNRETRVRPPMYLSGWTGVSVRCPAGAFVVEAVDESAVNWLAFREPAEVGWASAAAEWLVQRATALGGLAVLLLTAAVLVGRTSDAPSARVMA